MSVLASDMSDFSSLMSALASATSVSMRSRRAKMASLARFCSWLAACCWAMKSRTSWVRAAKAAGSSRTSSVSRRLRIWSRHSGLSRRTRYRSLMSLMAAGVVMSGGRVSSVGFGFVVIIYLSGRYVKRQVARAAGVEPAPPASKAGVLPLNYAHGLGEASRRDRLRRAIFLVRFPGLPGGPAFRRLFRRFPGRRGLLQDG